MSLTRRIWEGAQSGVTKLAQLVIVDDEPLSHVDSAMLRAELESRRAAREQAPRKASENPVARIASSSPAAQAERKRLGKERTARVSRDRDKRAQTQKAHADDAMKRMREQAARASAASTGQARASSSTGSGQRTSRVQSHGSKQAAQVAEWCRTLDVPTDADAATIKSAYRKLMRKYHPDMHAGNPQKHKAATELSMRVTTAYDGLSALFEKE